MGPYSAMAARMPLRYSFEEKGLAVPIRSFGFDRIAALPGVRGGKVT